MNETINGLNVLMVDFYDHWERENTNEMFLLLSGNNNTTEIELSIEKNNRRLEAIEELINDKDNFNLLIENWNLIDLKLLDSLVESFEIDIAEFIKRVNSECSNKEIIDFFKES